MNYYNEIKNELINNEINRKVKNYSINRSDLNTYYNVGKMLSEAGKHYGEGIIKEYSQKAEKPISYKQADVLYKSGKNYTWIYEYMTKSEFWAFVKLAREQGWNKETFIEQIEGYISKEVDEEIKADLEALYIYVME